NTEGLEVLGQGGRARRPVETTQCVDHGFLAVQACRPGISPEFPVTGHPHHDDAREDAEYQLRYDHRQEIPDPVTAVVLQHDAVYDVTDDPGQENHECVHNALDEGERDHVAVGDVG